MRSINYEPKYRSMRYHVLKELEENLDQDLWYHGIHHTRDVLNVCNQYIRRLQLSDTDRLILRTAAILHDYGFLCTYDNHEKAGCSAARKLLPIYDYSPEQIEQVCALIMATRIPQNATNLMERIICDADLDYLGRNDFEKIAESLFRELKDKKKVEMREQWNKIQYSFLSTHSYFTDYAKRYRAAQKERNLYKVEEWLKRFAPDYLIE